MLEIIAVLFVGVGVCMVGNAKLASAVQMIVMVIVVYWSFIPPHIFLTSYSCHQSGTCPRTNLATCSCTSIPVT